MKYLPTVILFCIYGCVLGFSLIYQTLFAINYGKTDLAVSYMYMLSDFLTNLTVIGQSIVYTSNARDIFDKFIEVEMLLKQQLFIVLDTRKLRADYKGTIYLVLVCVILMIMVKFFIRTNESDLLLGLTFGIFRVFNAFTKMHIYFFVYLLHYILRYVADYVEVVFVQTGQMFKMSTGAVLKITDNFRYYKIIYFKLYIISMEINQIFGWSLVMLFLQCFLDAAYSLYWIFLDFHSDDGAIICLRNYFDFRKHDIKGVGLAENRDSGFEIYKIDFDKDVTPCLSIYRLVVCSIIFTSLLLIAIRFLFSGPICNFLSAVVSTTILINACHYCTVQVNSVKTYGRYNTQTNILSFQTENRAHQKH